MLKRMIQIFLVVLIISLYSLDSSEKVDLVSFPVRSTLHSGKPTIHPSLYKIRIEEHLVDGRITKKEKDEFILNLRKFSNEFKDGLPEERNGIAFFKGKAKCITCHNSLYIYRTNDYLSKLMEYNRTGSKIKIEVKFDHLGNFSSNLQEPVVTPAFIRAEDSSTSLIDYLKDDSDLKWSKISAIPSA